MKFENVRISAFGYELAPNVITSEDIEEKLTPLYEKLHIRKGQLEAITGIRERRFWDRGFRMYEGAVLAGKKALAASRIDPAQIGMFIYGGVCRDNLEPATACAAAHGLELGQGCQIFDISNACLGVMNGMIQVANAIELGQIKAAMVVSCESSRPIVELTIARLLKHNDMEYFRTALATLTGGSGAVAVVLTHRSLSENGHEILGAVVKNASRFHDLCRWGPDAYTSESASQVMETDSIGVLKNGVALGIETFAEFRDELALNENQPDKIICHQVGSAHQKTILNSLGIPEEKDFTTFRFLGNIGTVSLPITAAIAAERGFFNHKDLVGFFGIGSGLNCLMMGVRWSGAVS